MPTRLIRESILTSQKVDRLTLGGEVFYRRLMSAVDDFGRFHAARIVLLGTLFPLRADDERVTITDVKLWLEECRSSKLITLYRAESREFLELTNFKQRVRATTSRFPAPNEENIVRDAIVASRANQTLSIQDENGDWEKIGDVESIRMTRDDSHMPDSCQSDDGQTSASRVGSRGVVVVEDEDVDEKEKREKKKNTESVENKSPASILSATESPTLAYVIEQITQRWNELPNEIRKIKTFGDTRKRKLATRLKDRFFRENYTRAIAIIGESDFCKGDNRRNWSATLTWFLRPDTVANVMEGNYTDEKKASKIDHSLGF